MTRTPSNGDETYQLMNMLIPDEGPLAVINALYEAKNGKLTAVDPEADEQADDGAKYAGIVGYSQLSGTEFTYCKAFGQGQDRQAIIDLAVEAIARLPAETLDAPYATGMDVLPATLAVMVVWGTPDGRRWTAFYRHPELPEAIAAALLKIAAEDIAPATDDAPPKN